MSALNPWTLDKEVAGLAEHIKDSLQSSRNSNSLWKYFSLSSRAAPFEEAKGIEGKIDFLAMEVQALRRGLTSLPGSEGQKIPELRIVMTLINSIVGEGLTRVVRVTEEDQTYYEVYYEGSLSVENIRRLEEIENSLGVSFRLKGP